MWVLRNSGQFFSAAPKAITDKRPASHEHFHAWDYSFRPLVYWFGSEKFDLENKLKLDYFFPTAPQEAQTPVALSLPNSLSLSWSPPKSANGIITQYSLDMDKKLVYTGKGENYTITGTTLSLSGNRCVCVFSRWPLQIFLWISWVIFTSLGHQGNLGTLLAQTFLDSTDHVFEAECQCGPPMYMDSVSWLKWWHPSRSPWSQVQLFEICLRRKWLEMQIDESMGYKS